jgi:hypothetical protein
MDAVQELIAGLFRDLEVGRRVHGDGGAALAVAPDAQRNLLRHRARGHEYGRLLAEHPGDLRLEGLQVITDAVDVRPFVSTERIRDLAQSLRDGHGGPMSWQDVVALAQYFVCCGHGLVLR